MLVALVSLVSLSKWPMMAHVYHLHRPISDAFVQMHFTSGVDMAKAKCHIISSSKDLPFSSLFFCVKLKSNKIEDVLVQLCCVFL